MRTPLPHATHFGLDIGGTSMRVAGVDRTGTIVAQGRWDMDRSTTIGGFIDALATCALEVSARLGCDGLDGAAIGVALPGTLNAKRSSVVRSVNLAFLEGYQFAKALADRLGAPVRLFTDAEAATWGEYIACDAPPDRFVHLRLGTGVGCGVVLEAALQRLDLDRTDHLEVLVVDSTSDMPCCPCGRTGCLETIASGAALADRLATCGFSGGLTGFQESILSGDADALALLADLASAVATVIDHLRDRYSPTMLVLGGGVIEHLPALFDRIQQVHQTRSGRTSSMVLRLQRARRGDDAGVIGAAMLAAEHSSAETSAM